VPELPSVLARLPLEAALEHREADHELTLLLADPSAYAYRTWLSHQLAFHAPVETALENTPGLSGIIAVRPRFKSSRLRSDLIALGIEPELVAKLTPCPRVPAAFPSVPIALGWLYVAERPTLGFRDVFRQLTRALPAQLAFASAYLKGYEGTAGIMWRAYAAAVEATCRAPAVADAVVAAARDAFAAHRGTSAIARASVEGDAAASPAMRG